MTFFSILALYMYSQHLRKWNLLMPEVKNGMLGVVYLITLQVALGITTLLYLVPVPVAVVHQINSLTLLTGCLLLGSRVWGGKGLLRLMEIAKSRAVKLKGPGSLDKVVKIKS